MKKLFDVLILLFASIVAIYAETYLYCFNATELCKGGDCRTGWNNVPNNNCTTCCQKYPTCIGMKVEVPKQPGFYISWSNVSDSDELKCPYPKTGSSAKRYCQPAAGTATLMITCTYNLTEIEGLIQKDVINRSINETLANLRHFLHSVDFNTLITQLLLDAIKVLTRRTTSSDIATLANLDNFRREIYQMTSERMQQLVSGIEKRLKPNVLARSEIESVLDDVDGLFNVSRDVIKDSEDKYNISTRILSIINLCGQKMLNDSNKVTKYTTKNFEVSARKMFKSPPPPPPPPPPPTNIGSTVASVELVRTEDVSLLLPASALYKAIDTLPSSESHYQIPPIAPLQLISVVYTDDLLFSKWDDHSSQREREELSERIISTQIYRHIVRDLKQPVRIEFQTKKVELQNYEAKCVYWNITNKAWQNDGVTVASTSHGSVVCHSTHLTNFAVLFNAKAVNNIHANILNMLSYIGMGISTAGALLTLVTYIAFASLRKNTPQKILINLCTSIILMHVIFFVGIERKSKSKAVCQSVAFLLQYSFLAIFTWNFIEGFHSMRSIAAPMKQEISKFILKASILGWGLPLIITGIGFSIWPENYSSAASCVVYGEPFYATVLAPIVLVMSFNIIALCAIMLALPGARSKDRTNALNFHQRLRIAIVFMVLFGMTWIFGFFVINNDQEVFQYVFCILSSLQGLYIMIAYCLRNKKVRKCWMALVKCRSLNQISRISKSGKRGSIGNQSMNSTSLGQSTISNPHQICDDKTTKGI